MTYVLTFDIYGVSFSKSYMYMILLQLLLVICCTSSIRSSTRGFYLYLFPTVYVDKIIFNFIQFKFLRSRYFVCLRVFDGDKWTKVLILKTMNNTYSKIFFINNIWFHVNLIILEILYIKIYLKKDIFMWTRIMYMDWRKKFTDARKHQHNRKFNYFRLQYEFV